MTGLNNSAPLRAVILAGGQSSRMGKDKAWLSYHSKPQILHLHDLLRSQGLQVFISANHWPEKEDLLNFYPDLPELSGHGPISGLLSIYKKSPNCALLLVGCDYPNLGADQLQLLLEQRNSAMDATCFVQPNSLLEPLCTIYEPGFMKSMYNTFMESGHDSLRQFLQRARVISIPVVDENWFYSADTPEDFLRWKGEKI